MDEKNNKFDEDFYGGMYNLLKLIDKLLFKAKDKEITSKEIFLFCPYVSNDTISKNMTRLVKVGALEKIESRDPTNCNCRVVKYKLKGEFVDGIRNDLYN